MQQIIYSCETPENCFKVEFISNDVFCSRLMSWNPAIPQGTADRILMRLDEYNSGGVTPHNLTRVLGNMSLQEFVGSYSRGAVHFLQFPYLSCSCGEQTGEKPSALDTSLIQVVPGHELRTPLLVWIDDRPENNTYEVAQARGVGIYVIEMTSTAMAKAWVDANLCEFIFSFISLMKYSTVAIRTAFLRDNDHPSRLRFISDNVRLETTPGAGTYLNPTAGECFLRYLRGRCFISPVLIYTGWSIDSTRYVESYDAAGSTTRAEVALEYIENLAAGKDDDTKWRGFDVMGW